MGAFNVNCTNDTPYLEMFEPMQGFAPIADIRCEKPMLVGCFEKKDGPGYAFTLVNMTDPAAPAPLEAKLQIDGLATAYYAGEPLALTPDSDGYVSFTLPAGEGVFVTVD